MLRRLLPAQAQWFIIEPIPADAGRDVFEIGSRGGKVVLRGNNGVAIASALNWYLKYFCRCHVSLKTRQLNLPDRLPLVQPAVRRVSRDRYRYFLNYCCFGYSLPWYDWAQWERFFKALDSALETGAVFDEKTFDQDLQAWERRWTSQHERYPTRPRGDTVRVSRQLWEKYRQPLGS